MALLHQIRRSFPLALAAGLLAVAACTHPSSKGLNVVAPSPDPRVGLKAGLDNAGEASWNMKLVSNTPPSEKFVGQTNSDLAFTGPYVIQGSYAGYQVWDVSDAEQAGAQGRVLLPRVAERRVGIQEPTVRFG